MITGIGWHDVPRAVRRTGFAVAVGGALIVVFGLAAVLLAVLVLHVARAGDL